MVLKILVTQSISRFNSICTRAVNAPLSNQCPKRWLTSVPQLPPPVQLSSVVLEPPTSHSNSEPSSPVIIFHGLFGCKSNWRSLGKGIAQRTGRIVHCCDLRNHGQSGRSRGDEMNLLGMAHDIKHYMDKNGISKSLLIGHSLGGRAVLQFSALFPQMIEKFVSVDIGIPEDDNGSALMRRPTAFFLKTEFIEGLRQAIDRVDARESLSEIRRRVDLNLRKWIEDRFIRGFFLMNLNKTEGRQQDPHVKWDYDLDAINGMITTDAVHKMYLKPNQYAGDCLFIHGSKSDYVREADYKYIRIFFPGAQFISIPDAGHFLHIEKPVEFLDALIPFINHGTPRQ